MNAVVHIESRNARRDRSTYRGPVLEVTQAPGSLIGAEDEGTKVGLAGGEDGADICGERTCTRRELFTRHLIIFIAARIIRIRREGRCYGEVGAVLGKSREDSRGGCEGACMGWSGRYEW